MVDFEPRIAMVEETHRVTYEKEILLLKSLWESIDKK